MPIFVYGFLHFFGKNEYKLPIYYPQGVKEGDTIYHQIPSFELKDQYNRSFNGKQLAGKIVIADFFFTSCGNPNFCPKMSEGLRRIQNTFEKNTDITLLSFTVDPQRDTPEVLLNYAQRYQAQKDKWFFLTGNKKDIYHLAEKGFYIVAGEEKDTVTPDFIHSSKLILVDKKGRIRGYYDGTQPEEIERLLVEIKILEKETNHL
ncbi:MAG: SCO family protein [Cytophagales bacterium]|nr:MAG: SCO family protein [Cytophagales bacterium]